MGRVYCEHFVPEESRCVRCFGPAKAAITPRAWPVLRRAVEEGVRYGYRRAHKHTESPGEERIIECVEDAVMNEIAEWFDFGGET